MRLIVTASLSYKPDTEEARKNYIGHDVLNEITKAADDILTARGFKPNRIDPVTREHSGDMLDVRVEF